MNILAIDTAEDRVSVSLGGRGIYYIEAEQSHSCSEFLMDMIDSLLHLARIEREEIDLVASLQGPGSWTGLRIGFAAAQGLALALDKPYTLVPTLDCIAYRAAPFKGIILPALDAKQQRFYCAAFREGERISDYLDATAEEIIALIADAPVLVTGSGAELLFPRLSALAPQHNLVLDRRQRTGNARTMLALLEENPLLKENGAKSGAGLLYLRKSDAEYKLNESLINHN